MPEEYRWKIVLIDDEEDIRDVMTVALEDAGYQVIAAQDGASGLRLCEEYCPQIVITDIRMPGIDGIQVLEKLKEKHPDIEVIVATAFGEMDLAIRALQLDASDFISKPINDDALQLALKRARERYSTRKQLTDYTDLLEKEKAETSQQLLANIRFQRNLIESSIDGILACDTNLMVVTFNRSMAVMSGYKRSDVIGRKPLNRFFPEDAQQRFKAVLAGTASVGKQRLSLYETSFLSADNRQISLMYGDSNE